MRVGAYMYLIAGKLFNKIVQNGYPAIGEGVGNLNADVRFLAIQRLLAMIESETGEEKE
jgi:hypothetical protein